MWRWPRIGRDGGPGGCFPPCCWACLRNRVAVVRMNMEARTIHEIGNNMLQGMLDQDEPSCSYILSN